MQSYSTIVGIIGMRRKGFSYDDVRMRYGVGSSSVTLIMKRFEALGCDLAALEAMGPREVESAFYPPENRRRRDVPLPDWAEVHARMLSMGKHADLVFIWIEYKEEHPRRIPALPVLQTLRRLP